MDTKLSRNSQIFVLNGADISQIGMFPPFIIEQLDVVKNILSRSFAPIIKNMISSFAFETSEKSFYNSIVPGVALATMLL